MTDELPEELAGQAASALLAVTGAERTAELAALLTAHPGHAGALQRLHDELQGVERVLDGAYRPADSVLHLGGHRVIRRLGEGAFGIVFLCTQEQPVVREVAVKVLKPGAGDENTLRRFGAERQLLASLNHPAITQLFDAGVLPDGRPYFVMEYVDGRPIRRYCDERALPCRDRLLLFIALCRGMAHAHQRGIVHRDLKPANVLVVEGDRGPLPKIIDFGIAKALFTAPDHDGPRTDAGRVLGTPGYMSPEQADGRSPSADERSDVFALGVMLYELLTGELPWSQGAAATDAEPLRPSARVTTSTSSTPSPPLPRQRAAELRGDLDWITLRALAREPEDRYPNAAALAADLERHLCSEAVSAGPPSAAYRLRKAMRRHRTVLAWAAACLVLLGTGTAVALRLGASATSSDEARLQAVSEAVASLQRRASEIDEADGPDQVVQLLLQEALALHGRELRSRPDRVDLRRQRTRLLTSLASICCTLGDYRRGSELAEEALRESRQLQQLDPSERHRRDQASALSELCRCHFMLEDFAAARDSGAEAIELYEQLHRTAPIENAGMLSKTLVEYGAALGRCGDRDGRLVAQQRAREVLQALAVAKPADGQVQRDLVRVHCGLATVLLAGGQHEAAESALQEARTLVETLPLVTDEERALVALRQARLCAATGQPVAATAHAGRAIEWTEAVVRQHPRREQQRFNLIVLHQLAFEQHVERHDHEAAVTHATALVAMGGLSPSLALQAADTLIAMAHRTLASLPFGYCAAAETWVAAALERLASAGTSKRIQELRVEALVLRAHALAELGRPLPAASLDELAASAHAQEQPGHFAFARLHSSRRRLLDGDLTGARRDLAVARQGPSQDVSPADVARLALAIELGARDHEAAALAAGQVLSCDLSMKGRVNAALGFAQAATIAGGAACAAEYRNTALELCRTLANGVGNEDLQQLTRAQASLCIAELAGGDAQESAHLAVLDGLRGRVPASSWNEWLWLSTHTRAIRGRLQKEQPEEALATAELLVAKLASPLELVDVAALCVECGTARAEGVAGDALRRAADLGLRGGRSLLDRADLATLWANETLRALIARIPD